MTRRQMFDLPVGSGIVLTFIATSLSEEMMSPKGVKVYPASGRRSSKRVGHKGQLAPHCVS